MRSTWVVGVLLLLLASAIAAVAAYFSITGLAKLFAASLLPVIIMASVLEGAKLGSTFFLHRYWDDLPGWKHLLSGMVIILMVLTSMGIFGFLSKGHLEQEAPAKTAMLQINRLDPRIESHETTVSRENKRLGQLDAVIQKLLDFDKVSGPTGSRAVRKDQAVERKEIQASIDDAYKQIDLLQEDRLPLAQKISGIEAELGPIKYVAELFGFDLKNGDGKGKAVRFVIVLLMAAFDPLAIILIMAADWTFLRNREEIKTEKEAFEKKIREDAEEKEEKAEAKREAARIKKEEKEQIATEKKETALARKEAREREKEVEALSLENEAKRLDLDRKRIENDKLRDSNNVNMHIDDDAVTVDVTAFDPVKNLEDVLADTSTPSEDILKAAEEAVIRLNEREDDEVILANTTDGNSVELSIDVDLTIDDSPVEPKPSSGAGTGWLATDEPAMPIPEDEPELDGPAIDEDEEEVQEQPTVESDTDISDTIIGDNSGGEEIINDEDGNGGDSEEFGSDSELSIIPELEAEYTTGTVQDDNDNDTPERGEDENIQVSADKFDDNPMSDFGSTNDDEEIINTLDANDPLAFIGEAFSDDKQLVNYLLVNEDVFAELVKLRDETEDVKIREGIEEVISAVMQAKSKNNTGGWLQS